MGFSFVFIYCLTEFVFCLRIDLPSIGNDLQRGWFGPYNEGMWTFSPFRQTKTQMKMFTKKSLKEDYYAAECLSVSKPGVWFELEH